MGKLACGVDKSSGNLERFSARVSKHALGASFTQNRESHTYISLNTHSTTNAFTCKPDSFSICLRVLRFFGTWPKTTVTRLDDDQYSHGILEWSGLVAGITTVAGQPELLP